MKLPIYKGFPIIKVLAEEYREILKGEFTTLNGEDRKLKINKQKLRELLKIHIFGETFLMKIDIGSKRGSHERKRLTVAGSDGSTHASNLHLRKAQQYEDDPNLIIKFNNSMAYVHLPENFRKKIPYPFHSIPITRSAMDDPTNRGMIVARPMFPNIEDDSVYEHMARCTTDVVQNHNEFDR